MMEKRTLFVPGTGKDCFSMDVVCFYETQKEASHSYWTLLTAP